MSYNSQSTNIIPQNNEFPAINRANFWILSIGRKELTAVQHVLETISSQQLIGKGNKVHVTIAQRDKNIVRTNLEENRSNQTHPGNWGKNN